MSMNKQTKESEQLDWDVDDKLTNVVCALLTTGKYNRSDEGGDYIATNCLMVDALDVCIEITRAVKKSEPEQ